MLNLIVPNKSFSQTSLQQPIERMLSHPSRSHANVFKSPPLSGQVRKEFALAEARIQHTNVAEQQQILSTSESYAQSAKGNGQTEFDLKIGRDLMMMVVGRWCRREVGGGSAPINWIREKPCLHLVNSCTMNNAPPETVLGWMDGQQVILS